MSLHAARAVADAMMFEGYLLYPYRASAQKNQVRWQFGVLTPPSWEGEPSAQQTECLVEPGDRLRVVVRYLRIVPGEGPLDEGEPREVTAELGLDPAPEHVVPFDLGLVRVAVERLDGPIDVRRLRVRVENSAEPGPLASRDEALRHALVAAHTLLEVPGGRFVSLLDPPEWAAAAVAACTNDGTFPVLVGDDVMLSSPIILYDHPAVAAESPGDLFDATEIDEILTLRTMAMTDEEKAEARATDPRAAAIVDRTDTLPPEYLERLHGAIRYLGRTGATPEARGPGAASASGPRPWPVAGADAVEPGAAPQPRPAPEATPWWDPGADSSVSPETDSVVVAGAHVARGSRVRLRPGSRRADAQDMFLNGRLATVEAVLFDVDDARHLAVTLDDDPGAELQRAHGRFLYFAPDEVEPVQP